MLLVTAVFLRLLSNSLGNVYQKKLTITGCNPILITTVTYLLLTASCVPFILLYGIGHPKGDFYFYAVIMGLLGAIGNGFLVKAFKDGEMSVLGPINSYKSIMGLILACVLLHEYPSLSGLVGIVLIIAGSYFVLDTLPERFSFSLLKNKQIQYRFLALIFCSFEAVAIKKLILISSVWDTFAAWCFFGALFSLVLLRLEKIDLANQLEVFKTRNFSFFINIVICIGIMQFTTNYLFAKMNVAYALALFQLSTIFSVFFGKMFFNEKNILKKFWGALIMCLGAILIVLYS